MPLTNALTNALNNTANRDDCIHTESIRLLDAINAKIFDLKRREEISHYAPHSEELKALTADRAYILKLAQRTRKDALPRCSACGAEGARIGPRPGDEVCDNCRSDNHD